MKFVIIDYNTNSIYQIDSSSTLMKKILDFRQETRIVDIAKTIEYYSNNKDLPNSQQIRNLCNDKRLVTIFHQDSERDVMIFNDSFH